MDHRYNIIRQSEKVGYQYNLTWQPEEMDRQYNLTRKVQKDGPPVQLHLVTLKRYEGRN